MKIAYIMQCHKNPKQINRLVDAIVDENCDVYIHIDKKSENIREYILKPDNVFILPYEASVSVTWGDVSQIHATLALIKAVIDCPKKYDYVWFISGQDYPIKDKKAIYDFLEKDKEMAFIDVMGDSHIQKYKKRCEIYYPQWMISRKPLIRIIRRLWIEMTGGKRHTYSMFKRRKYVDDFYFGSCWWCLPYDCVIEIMKLQNEMPEILEYLKHSICPDECYFQTIFKKTSFASKSRKNLTYIDWSNCNSSPRTLTCDDFDTFMSSNFLFARKFDEQIDAEVFSKIDAEIKTI